VIELRKIHGWAPPSRWPTVAEIETHQARMIRATAIKTFAPTTLGVPTILDQDLGAPDGTGACFGFAAVQAEHIDRQVRGQSGEILSPVIPYFYARREAVSSDAEVTDSGSDPDSMTAAMNDFGACPMSTLPFDASRINMPPGDVALLAAQKVRCKISPILATGPLLWTAIQHVICIERLPVLIALNVVPAFDNAADTGGIIDNPSGTSRGGHAQCLYGVTAQGAQDANSWGIGQWTPDGTAILTPRFIAGAVMWAGALEIES
jgi:hypothetical protein